MRLLCSPFEPRFCQAGRPGAAGGRRASMGRLAPAAFAAPAKPEVVVRTKHCGGVSVFVGKGYGVTRVRVASDSPRPGMVMHWAVGDWELPSPEALPPGSVHVADGRAVQTPFVDGESVTITFPEAETPDRLVFVLREGREWASNQGRDWVTELRSMDEEDPAPLAEPEALLLKHYPAAGVWVFAGRTAGGAYRVRVTTDYARPNLVMHWAVDDWRPPPEGVEVPPGSVTVGSCAAQTPFQNGESVTLTFPEADCPARLVFVLREGDHNWINNGGADFSAPLKHEDAAAAAPLPAEPGLLLDTPDGGTLAVVVPGNMARSTALPI